MQPVNSGTAYLLWCLGLVGICGGQRFYTGQVGVGVVYLLTIGVFGFGQLLDLILIPGLVSKRNVELRGLAGQNQIVLNIGDIPQLQGLQQLQTGQSTPDSSMQKLLKAAKENGGQLSLAQAAMATNLTPEKVKELLQESIRAGYADINNDPQTGAVRYHFDV